MQFSSARRSCSHEARGLSRHSVGYPAFAIMSMPSVCTGEFRAAQIPCGTSRMHHILAKMLSGSPWSNRSRKHSEKVYMGDRRGKLSTSCSVEYALGKCGHAADAPTLSQRSGTLTVSVMDTDSLKTKADRGLLDPQRSIFSVIESQHVVTMAVCNMQARLSSSSSNPSISTRIESVLLVYVPTSYVFSVCTSLSTARVPLHLCSDAISSSPASGAPSRR